jgi:hypothetical protein
LGEEAPQTIKLDEVRRRAAWYIVTGITMMLDLVDTFSKSMGSVFDLIARRRLFSHVGHGSGMAAQFRWK